MTQPTIMLIGGGIQHIEAVKSAQRCGYKVLVSDRSADSPCFEHADFTAVLDGRNVEELIAYVALNKHRLNIQGVFTLTELVTSVASIAAANNLPGVPVLSAVSCQNKHLSKMAWQRSGVSTPQGCLVETQDEALSFFETINAEVILKPPIGFGAKGMVKANTHDQLKQLDFSQAPYLIEACIDGTMHDVNGVFDAQGTFHPLGCFDRTFDKGGFIESGAVYPSQLSPNLVQSAYDLTEQAARALDITWGPVKSDLVLSSDGFLILELAPRLHGPKGTLYLSAMTDQQNHLERAFPTLTQSGGAVADANPTGQIASYELIPHPGRPFTQMSGQNLIEQTGHYIMHLNTHSAQTAYANSSEVVGFVFGVGDDVKTVKASLKKTLARLSFY